MDKIPGVTCDGDGFGPLELSSNVAGAVEGTSSVLNGNNNTGQKIVGGINGVYKMIPFYATNKQKQPKKGGWILGKADIAPDLKICYIESKYKNKDGTTMTKKIPYPVRKTNNYSISGGSTFGSSSNSGSWTGSTYNYE